MSSFIHLNNKKDNEQSLYSVSVIQNALLKTETKSQIKAESLTKHIVEPVSLTEALSLFSDKLKAINVLRSSRTNAINEAIEIAINEAKFKFSEKEVKDASERLAKAMAKLDNVHVAVHGFELSWGGEEFDGGSYYIKANGDVINAAVGGGTKYGTMKSSEKDFIKGIKDAEPSMRESVVNEKEFKAEYELKPGDSLDPLEKAIYSDAAGFPKRMATKLFKDISKAMSAKIPNIKYIQINTEGYFYITNVNDKVYDPGNLEDYSDMILFEPVTITQLAEIVIKKWSLKLENGMSITWISKSNWSHHYKDNTKDIKLFDVLLDGEVIGNAKNTKDMIDTLSSSELNNAYVNESVVNENGWGSSDQGNMNKSIHNTIGKPSKMPSPFDDSLRSAAEEEVDSSWSDWKEYESDRDGLIDKAVRHYLNSFFKKEFAMMQAMFAGNIISADDTHLFEGGMSDIYQLAEESKDEASFIKEFFKDFGDKVKKTADSIEWAKSIFVDAKAMTLENKSTRIDRNLGLNEGYMTPKVAKKLSIGSEVVTSEGTYTITGFGQRANAFKQFEAEKDGEQFNIQVSLYGSSDILVAKGKSLNFNEKGEMLESLNEGRSINKIQKEWSQTTTDMQQKVTSWKEAEGDRKIEILEELKALTTKKNQLESELEASVAGKDKDVQLAISESLLEKEVAEGNAFGAARAKAIADGEKEFEVEGETYKVEDVDKEDEENAEEFVDEAKSNIKKKWASTDVMMDDLREFITDAKDASGEDLVLQIHDALKIMTNYALGMTKESATNEAKEHSFIFNYNTDEDDIKYIQKVLDGAGADAVAKAGIDSEEMVIRAFNAKGLKDARKAIEADGFEIQESITALSWDALIEAVNQPLTENLRSDVKKFIKNNMTELNTLADNDQWDLVHQKLYTEFEVEAESSEAKDLLKAFQFSF